MLANRLYRIKKSFHQIWGEGDITTKEIHSKVRLTFVLDTNFLC